MLLISASFDFIIKVIKNCMICQKSTNNFTIYHLYYKEKLEMTKFRYNPNLFYKSNSLVVSIFAYNSNTCIVETGLAIKKKELKPFSYLLPQSFQLLFSTFSLKIFECVLISR